VKRRDDYIVVSNGPRVWFILDPKGWVVEECPSAEEALVAVDRWRNGKGRAPMNQTFYIIAVSVAVPREGFPADDWLTRTYEKSRTAWHVARRLQRSYGEGATLTVVKVG
jgi:hypothetical protein